MKKILFLIFLVFPLFSCAKKYNLNITSSDGVNHFTFDTKGKVPTQGKGIEIFFTFNPGYTVYGSEDCFEINIGNDPIMPHLWQYNEDENILWIEGSAITNDINIKVTAQMADYKFKLNVGANYDKPESKSFDINVEYPKIEYEIKPSAGYSCPTVIDVTEGVNYKYTPIENSSSYKLEIEQVEFIRNITVTIPDAIKID